MSIGKIMAVSAITNTALTVAWDDGHSARIDLGEIIATRPALASLSNAQQFATVGISADGWSLEWPCGVDFGAPQLRRLADEQTGQTMPAIGFRTWIDGHGFTLEKAADALGVSRRTIAYYLSGEQPVPKTVMLATMGYDQQIAA